MGKKRKHTNNYNNHNNGQQQKKKNKKNKKQRSFQPYWIEGVRESQGDVSNAALTILVTRVELVDDHTHTKEEREAQAAKLAEKEEKESTIVEADENEEEAVVAAPVKSDPQVEPEKKKKPKSAILVLEKAEEVPPTETTNEGTNSDEGEETPNVAADVPSKDPTTAPTKDEATEKVVKNDDKGAGSKVKAEKGEENEKAAAETIETKDQKTKSGNPFICFRRDASAKQKKKKFLNRPYFKPLPDGDCGDGIKNPFPKHVVDDKYWAQRHRLFSRFDDGIQLDRESWYSVTPEAIANHIARRMVMTSTANKNEKMVVIDAFCGAGGNAIALARQEHVELVVCVDLDEEKLKLAAHNAKIYDIADNKLLFLHADACDVLQQYNKGKIINEKAVNSEGEAKEQQHLQGYKTGGIELLPKQVDAVFLSPPWGGTDYATIGPRNYDLKCIHLEGDTTKDGEQMLESAYGAIPEDTGNVAIFLPRNTNGLELGRSASRVGISGVVEMEQNVLNHKFKAITVYAGRNYSGKEERVVVQKEESTDVDTAKQVESEKRGEEEQE